MLEWNRLGQDAGDHVFTCHVNVYPQTRKLEIRSPSGDRYFVKVTWTWRDGGWLPPEVGPVLEWPNMWLPCGEPDCGPPWVFLQLYIAVDGGGGYAEWELTDYAYNFARGCSEGVPCIRCD